MVHHGPISWWVHIIHNLSWGKANIVVYCSYTTNMLIENLYGEKPTEPQTGECHFSRHKFFFFLQKKLIRQLSIICVFRIISKEHFFEQAKREYDIKIKSKSPRTKRAMDENPIKVTKSLVRYQGSTTLIK